VGKRERLKKRLPSSTKGEGLRTQKIDRHLSPPKGEKRADVGGTLFEGEKPEGKTTVPTKSVACGGAAEGRTGKKKIYLSWGRKEGLRRRKVICKFPRTSSPDAKGGHPNTRGREKGVVFNVKPISKTWIEKQAPKGNGPKRRIYFLPGGKPLKRGTQAECKAKSPW